MSLDWLSSSKRTFKIVHVWHCTKLMMLGVNRQTMPVHNGNKLNKVRKTVADAHVLHLITEVMTSIIHGL